MSALIKNWVLILVAHLILNVAARGSGTRHHIKCNYPDPDAPSYNITYDVCLKECPPASEIMLRVSKVYDERTAASHRHCYECKKPGVYCHHDNECCQGVSSPKSVSLPLYLHGFCNKEVPYSMSGTCMSCRPLHSPCDIPKNSNDEVIPCCDSMARPGSGIKCRRGVTTFNVPYPTCAPHPCNQNLMTEMSIFRVQCPIAQNSRYYGTSFCKCPTSDELQKQIGYKCIKYCAADKFKCIKCGLHHSACTKSSKCCEGHTCVVKDDRKTGKCIQQCVLEGQNCRNEECPSDKSKPCDLPHKKCCGNNTCYSKTGICALYKCLPRGHKCSHNNNCCDGLTCKSASEPGYPIMKKCT